MPFKIGFYGARNGERRNLSCTGSQNRTVANRRAEILYRLTDIWVDEERIEWTMQSAFGIDEGRYLCI
jgi:hypothetical protein